MAGSFSSFELNVASSKKPFLTTLPSPASPTQSLHHNALFYYVYCTYHLPEITLLLVCVLID